MTISPGALANLKTAAENYYSEMQGRMRRKDNLYHRRFNGFVNLPENIPVFESGRATEVIDNLRDQIRVDEPTVRALAAGTTKIAKGNAALQTLWGQTVFHRLASDTILDPISQLPFDLLLRGAACAKVMIKPSVLKGRPTKKVRERASTFNKRLKAWRDTKGDLFPYIVQAVDPLRVFPSPGIGPMTYVIEVQKRRVIDMWEQYPNWSDPKARAKRMSSAAKENPLREVQWVEYWSWYYNDRLDQWTGDYIVEADGERIIDQVNPYGLVPYTWRYSGLGRLNAEGDPAELAVTVLDSITSELEHEVMLKTAMSAQWQFHVFPRLIVSGMSDEDAARRFQKGPGAVIQKPLEGTVEWLETPEPNEAMIRFMDALDAAIERRISPALSGQRNADFGIHQALLLGQALKIVSPIKAQLNYMGTNILEQLGAITHRLDVGMNLNGTLEGVEKTRSVSGENFAHRAFDVKFEAVDPTENDRKMLAGLSVAKQPGMMSRETYRNNYLKGVVDSSEEEEERVLAEQLQDQMVASGALMPFVMQQIQLQQEQADLESATTAATSSIRDGATRAAAGREQSLESLFGGGGQIPTETADTGLTQGGV